MTRSESMRKIGSFVRKKKKLFEKSNYTCEICGFSIAEDIKRFDENPKPKDPMLLKKFYNERSILLGKIQIHHIIPLSENGSNRQHNLIVICEKCHVALHIEEQLRLNGTKNKKAKVIIDTKNNKRKILMSTKQDTNYKGVNFFSQFYGCFGISNHARNFGRALKSLTDIRMLQYVPSMYDDYDILNGNNQPLPIVDSSRYNPDYDNLIFWYPHTYTKINDRKHIVYYIFEYTIIPKDFVARINTMDSICTASNWGKEILKSNGVKIPIHVIRGGVDFSRFNMVNRKPPKNSFKFLHVGKVENRKGTELVIRAFNEAFKGNNDIRLTLSIDNPHSRLTAEEFLYDQLMDKLEYDIFNIDIVHFVPNIKDLYDSHHCGVFPSLAEGIGLPIVEAMACGLPSIIPFNSGITEYASETNCILLTSLVEVPVYDPLFFPQSGSYGTWQAPKLEHLIEKMIWAYEHQEEAAIIGARASNWMADNFTWEHSATKFADIFLKK